jgi:hypothetical protein
VPPGGRGGGGADSCPIVATEVPRPGEARDQVRPTHDTRLPRVRSMLPGHGVGADLNGSAAVVLEGEPRHPRRSASRVPPGLALSLPRGPNGRGVVRRGGGAESNRLPTLC